MREDSSVLEVKKKKKVIPLEQLFYHTSDFIIKPIVGNSEIEKTSEPVYEKEKLPFKVISMSELVNNTRSQAVEKHFEKIYNELISNSSEKLNVLNYLESIITHCNISNRIINSEMVLVLSSLLKTSKNKLEMIRICSIIGALVRYSTIVEKEVKEFGIDEMLVDKFFDGDEKLRRKAVSALGEYLFFCATQIDEDPESKETWYIKDISYKAMLKTISEEKIDEISKFYAVKTIENITMESFSSLGLFCNNEIVDSLINLLFKSQNSKFLSSVAVCLSNISREKAELGFYILKKIQIPNFLNYLYESQPKVQQPLLGILIVCIFQDKDLNICLPIIEEKSLLPSLIGLIDSSVAVIRGKVILIVIQLIRVHISILHFMIESKLFTFLDKIDRDSNEYVQGCFGHLINCIEEVVENVLSYLGTEIHTLLNGYNKNLIQDNEDSIDDYNLQRENSKSSDLQLFFGIISSCLDSKALMKKIINYKFLEMIFTFFYNSDQFMPQYTEIRNSIIAICKVICSDPEVIEEYRDLFESQILELLTKRLTSNLVDVRFFSLNYLIDILTRLESNGADKSGKQTKKLSEKILKIVRTNVFPLVLNLIADEDPIPLYIQNLLTLLLTNNPEIIKDFAAMKLTENLMSLYSPQNSKISMHTLALFEKIIESPAITLEYMNATDFLNNVVLY